MTQIIKDDITLDFDGEITLRKQIRQLDNLSASYTVSYAFELPQTNKNLTAFGIASIDQAVKLIYKNVVVDLVQGSTTIRGNLRVEGRQENIECSFLSDSFDFLNLLTADVKHTIFRSYTYSWPNKGTSGYVDIPVNNGTNRNTWNATGFLNYIPSFLVREVIKDILQGQGIKLEGDIINDWRYQKMIITNQGPYIEYDDEFIFDHTFFAGKTSNQSITGATTITFTSETGVYYDNPSWWDGNDDMQTDVDRFVAFELNLLFDTSGAHTIQIIGSISGSVYSNTISAASSAFVSSYFLADSSETYHVAVTPTSGTINVLSGSSFKVWTFTSFDNNGSPIRAAITTLLPRFLLPSKTQADFVTEIFSLFNPIIDFNPVTKVLTVNFFEKIQTRTEEDWSAYLDSYGEDYEETLQSYGRKSLMTFAESSEEAVSQYNDANEIPFGAGSLDIDNDFISAKTEILNIPYEPSSLLLNIAQQAYLPVFTFFPDEDPLQNRLLLAPVLTVSDFSNNATINGQATLAYGYFVKASIGKNVDNIKANLAFETPVGYDGTGLKQDYFRKTESILNDPVKLSATMYLPEAVYQGLDFSTPKRIKTSKFNSQFYVLSVEGWEASHLPCEVELIKL